MADSRLRTTNRLRIFANIGYAEWNSYAGTTQRLTCRLIALTAVVIAPSAVMTLFRIPISIYDHSMATLSVRTVSNEE
jgi:hypothetical protein